jgi:23S rRNA G2445 N2-methylase RlmL
MTGPGEQPRSSSRRSRLFATCVPGLGRMLRRELDAIAGISSTGLGFDGRADIVFFEADRAGRAEALQSRLAEGMFAEVGRASRAGGAGAAAVAAMAWQPDAVQRALSVWADEVRPLSRSMTYRVSVRVLSAARFRRLDLRQALSGSIARDKPRWRFADPAQLEICISEFHDGQYAAGLLLGGAGIHQQGGQESERQGDLPLGVAAAMIDLAGPPGAAGGVPGTLLDPCCGSGTILGEALVAGWAAEGADIDPDAVQVAARNAAGASVQLGDARELLLADDCVGACVCDLRLARPSQVPGGWQDWVSGVLAEMNRVTRSGGCVVLLAAELPRSAIPGALRLRKQVPVRLRGARATIWVFHRA